MKKARICLMAVAAVFCALVLSPGVTRADELTGSSGISWICRGTTFATDTIAAGSSLIVPGRLADLRWLFAALEPRRFSVGTSSISYSVSNFPVGDYGGTHEWLRFHGALRSPSGDSLTGFHDRVKHAMGLTASDITIGPSSIFINLTGLPIDGSFTIDLISGPAVSTPEPSSLVLLGIGLLALMGLAGKRFAAGRFALESAS